MVLFYTECIKQCEPENSSSALSTKLPSPCSWGVHI